METKRKYHTLMEKGDDGIWSPQFGDWVKQVVVEEKADYKASGIRGPNLKVVTASDESIQALMLACAAQEIPTNLFADLPGKPAFWLSGVGEVDDFGKPVGHYIIDGMTVYGPWALMTPETHKKVGMGLGLGRGQLYGKRPDGKWQKIV